MECFIMWLYNCYIKKDRMRDAYFMIVANNTSVAIVEVESWMTVNVYLGTN